MANRYFLDETGLKFLVTQLMGKMDLKISSRMVTLINDESTHDDIPSAKSVYDTLIEGLSNITGVSFQVVETLPETGDAGVIYLIKDEPENESSSVYVQWVYVGEAWINLGSSEVDLENYWSKDELEPLSNSDIQEILDEVGLGGSGEEEPGEPEEPDEPEP
jgi:hypothetical protein